MTQKFVKGSAIANHLAENPLDDVQPVTSEFPDENIMAIEGERADEEDIWKMYFDGAVNVHGNGIGAVIISPSGKQYPVTIKFDFDYINNIAKYEACAQGLQVAIELGVEQLEVYGDVALIIYQVNGEW